MYIVLLQANSVLNYFLLILITLNTQTSVTKSNIWRPDPKYERAA